MEYISIFLREPHLHLLFVEADILVKDSQGFIKQIWSNSFFLIWIDSCNIAATTNKSFKCFFSLLKKTRSVALVMNLFLIDQLCWKYLCIPWNSITVINHAVKQVYRRYINTHLSEKKNCLSDVTDENTTSTFRMRGPVSLSQDGWH